MKCRCCHNLLESTLSCPICKEASQAIGLLADGGNILDDLYDGNQEEDLKTVSQQSIRLIRRAQTLLEDEMKASEVYSSAKTREILKLASASQKSLQEAIKLEKEFKKQAENMTQDEKIDVMLKFYERLPPEKQKAIIQEMTRAYNNQKKNIARF